MKLSRPIVFFDIETTGLDTAKDRIVTLYAYRIGVNKVHDSRHYKVNPGIRIGKDAIAVHGITDEMVKDWPPFGDIAEELVDFIRGCNISGYNIVHFDISVLLNELIRIGRNDLAREVAELRPIDVFELYKVYSPRTLSAAYKHFKGKELIDNHDVVADAKAAIAVMWGIINSWEEDEIQEHADKVRSTDDLYDGFFGKRYDHAGKLVRNAHGKPEFAFGKYNGFTVDYVWNRNRDYIEWLVSSYTIPTQTRMVLADYIRSLES